MSSHTKEPLFTLYLNQLSLNYTYFQFLLSTVLHQFLITYLFLSWYHVYAYPSYVSICTAFTTTTEPFSPLPLQFFTTQHYCFTTAALLLTIAYSFTDTVSAAYYYYSTAAVFTAYCYLSTVAVLTAYFYFYCYYYCYHFTNLVLNVNCCYNLAFVTNLLICTILIPIFFTTTYAILYYCNHHD